MKSMLGMILQVCELFFQVKMLTGKVLGTQYNILQSVICLKDNNLRVAIDSWYLTYDLLGEFRHLKVLQMCLYLHNLSF